MEETKKTTEEEVNPVFAQIEGELKTRFELLPTELQQMILSSDYQTKLFELAKKHKLTYEKLGQLELETTMVLLGMTPPDEYKADIADQLKLTGSALDELVGEINRDVFIPIREKLMGVYTKEEVELGEKFATEASKETSETKVAESPYREPILPKTPLNTGAIPTFDKNEFDSKKEVGLTPEKKGVGLIPSIDLNRINTTPVSPDPYRELPVVGTNVANPVIQPLPTHSPLTPDEIKTIPKIEINTTKTLETASIQSSPTPQNNELRTIPQHTDQHSQAPLVHTPQNSSETLQGIAALKTALMSDIEAKKLAPEKTPIVTKEEIIVDTLRTTQPSAQLQSIQQGSNPNTADTTTIINDSEKAHGEVFSQQPKSDSVETNELMRTIKLQFDENQINQERQARAATIQKIDSMIDFKKAGNFMNQETANNQSTPSTEQTSSVPMSTKFSGDILEKDHTSGQIFDSKIDMLGKKVKKTGFFGKLKNFFGSKVDQVNTLQTNETIDMLPKISTTLAPNNINTANTTTNVQLPTSPVSDMDVENVKIFDEITVAKK